jgi:hypothetical protein
VSFTFLQLIFEWEVSLMRLTLGRRFFAACIALSAVVSAATLAKAAVVVEAHGPVAASAVVDAGTGAFTINYDVQSANTDVLVIGAYFDNSSGGTTADTNGISFDGVLADDTISSQRSALSYWSSVPAPGTYALTGTSTAAAANFVVYYAWELSNVDLGLGVDSGVTAGLGGSITTSAGRLVTDFFGVNTQTTTPTIAPGATSISSPGNGGTFLAMTYNGSGGGSLGGGYNVAPATGSNDLAWTVTGNNTNPGVLAYAFAMPIPEPSSLMLLVGGVLLVAGRRRIVG